jgi:predicted NAD/FAD-binding protein
MQIFTINRIDALIIQSWNHHLLTTVSARPAWMTIPGGSQRYIDAVLEGTPADRLHLSSPVTSISSNSNGTVSLVTEGNHSDVFDHIILATHGDQALDIIRDNATTTEISIMQGFKTSKNYAVLHSDLDLMPKRRIAWSAWNFLTRSSGKSSNIDQVCLTYWMNLLQHIPEDKFGPCLVTLNPLADPKPELTQGRWDYSHPLYNPESIRSQSQLPSIQNTRGISYAGAWTKYGFHEDGFSSGIKVAKDHLGAKLPFEFVDSTFSRGKMPVLTWRDHIVRIFVHFVQLLFFLFGVSR